MTYISKLWWSVVSFVIGLGINKIFQWFSIGTAKRFLGKNNPTDIVVTYAVLYPSGPDKNFRHKPRKNGTEIKEKYRVYPAVSVMYIKFCKNKEVMVY